MTRIRIGCIIFFGILTASCGNHPDAYGVILWSESTGDSSNAAIIPISETSRAGDRHVYGLDSDGGGREIESWRVRLFEDLDSAESFRIEYQEYADLYARANVNALPVRQRDDRLAPIVYRLRLNERMKILDRSAEPSNEGGLVAHWYRVLTEEGVEGYVFGHHLTVYDANVGIVEEEPEVDPVLNGFLSKVWRPVYFGEMIERGTFDLEVFTPSIGFFPEPENSRFRLVLPQYTETFTFDEIIQVASRRYLAEGSSLQFIVRGEDLASLQYTHDGEPASLAIQTIDEDIAEVIRTERERRDALYEDFFELGILHSSAYGTIEFFSDRVFEWRNYGRLVPNAIPQGAERSGTVAFDIYPGSSFESRYDGVISFYFDGAEGSPVRFLYAQSAGGVRMQFVPPGDVEENIVVRESLSSLVIFFSESE